MIAVCWNTKYFKGTQCLWFRLKNESNQSTEPSQPDCEYGKTGWYEIKSESMER